MIDDRYLDLKELSRYSCLSVTKLRSLLPEIPHLVVGRKVIVKRSDFDAWYRRRRRQAGHPSPMVQKILDKMYPQRRTA